MAGVEVSPLAERVIGRGLQRPFQFSLSKSSKDVSTTSGLAKIISSIQDIMLTRPGERMFMPEYGSALWSLVFEPNDPATNALLSFYTAEALRRWEPRVRLTSVNFVELPDNENAIGIQVAFTVLATHEEGNFVFPFERRGVPMGTAVTGVEAQRIFTPGSVLPLSGQSEQNIGVKAPSGTEPVGGF